MPTSSNRIPLPRPPKTKKAEVFNPDDYKELDEYVSQLNPRLFFGSINALVEELTGPTNSDTGRVRALFTWLTTANVDEVERLERIPHVHSPYAWLQNIKDSKTTHSVFFHNLCQAAGIHSVKIKGIAKNSRYQIGKEIDRARLRSQWNAVVVDGEWRLIDVLWCAKVESKKPALPTKGENIAKNNQAIPQRKNEFFFLTDPEVFIYTHLPDISKWQLLPNKLTFGEFESLPYLGERFFEMGLTLLEDSHKSVVLETNQSEVFIPLGFDSVNGNRNEFRHLLHPPNKDKIKPGAPKTDAKILEGKLKDAVSIIKHPEELRFHLHLPELGRYRFDVYGKNLAKANLNTFDLVCSYILDYKLDGLTCLEVRFFFKEPSEHARHLRRGGASDWLKKKDATLKVKGHEMILSIATPPGPNTIKYLLEDYEHSKCLVPSILRSLLYIIPEEAKLHEAYDIPNGPAEWKIGNMEIRLLSHVNGLVRTMDGKAKVRLSASKNTEIWYEFHEDNRKRGVPDGAVDFVVKDGTDHTIVAVTLTLDRPQNYLLTTFARAKGVQNKFYHVKTYRIEYELLNCV